MDFIRIEYQPSLGFEAFHQVDMDCFPDEPLDLDGFQFRLSQDFWAAMDGENLAGYCCVFRKGSLAWLGRLGVNPSYRRHGIGAELLKTAIQFSREMGMQEMMLYVLEDNFAALHIYEQFGFVRDEITYQYIWDTSHPDSLVVPDNVPRIRLLPVDEVPGNTFSDLPNQWVDLRDMHHPPGQYVFIFKDAADNTVGYCRLTPGFPGCFPFQVNNPETNLPAALKGLQKYLIPEKKYLKLTFNDPALAKACEMYHLRLNYRLYKMIRDV